MRNDKARKARREEYLRNRPAVASEVASDWVALLDSRYKSEGFEEMFVIVADAKNVGVIGTVPAASVNMTANLELSLASGFIVIGVVGLRPKGSNGQLRVCAGPRTGYENNKWAMERIDFVRLNLDKMMDEKNLHRFEPSEVN